MKRFFFSWKQQQQLQPHQDNFFKDKRKFKNQLVTEY